MISSYTKGVDHCCPFAINERQGFHCDNRLITLEYPAQNWNELGHTLVYVEMISILDKPRINIISRKMLALSIV